MMRERLRGGHKPCPAFSAAEAGGCIDIYNRPRREYEEAQVKRAGVLSGLLVVGALSFAAGSRAQPSTGRKVVELQKLKDNLYLLSGGGGNSAAFITDLGVVLVDTKLAGWGQPLLDKLKTVTDQAGDDHHQHPRARRPHRRQRILPDLGRNHRAGEHPAEHGQAGRLQGRQGELPAQADVQGEDDDRQRQGPGRPLLLRRGAHRRRCLGRLSGAARHARRRHAGVQSNRRPSISRTAAAAWRFPTRSPRRPPR